MKTHRRLLRVLTFTSLCLYAGSAFWLVAALHTDPIGAQPESASDALVYKALVIGNSHYRKGPSLANPIHDAQAMAQTFRDMGFEVIERTDLDRIQMEEVIEQFGRSLDAETAAFFYYAGHAIQYEGTNYLLPVDTDLQYDTEIPYKTVSMDRLLAKMDGSQSPVNVVLLDACRTYPDQGLTRTRSVAKPGLAQMNPPRGTVIAFATQPGKVAEDGHGQSHSPFTASLLDKMRQSQEMEIEDLLRRVRKEVVDKTKGNQVPVSQSLLTGNFYIRPPRKAVHKPVQQRVVKVEEPRVSKPVATLPSARPNRSEPVKAPASVKSADMDRTAEISYWDSIKNKTDPAFFQAYLDKYPRGQFADLARLNLQNLKTRPSDDARPVEKNRTEVPAEAVEAPDRPAPPNPAEVSFFSIREQASSERVRAEYLVAAQQGHVDAQYNVGWMYLEGRGGEQNDQEAFAWFLRAANQGHAAAQYHVGRMYQNGQGVTRDMQEAARWFQLSAEQGYVWSQNNLGVMYLEGRGVTKNAQQAAYWFEKAALQGDAAAQYNLGGMYMHGASIPANPQEAVKWLRLAAEQGWAAAQNDLGKMYLQGRGIAKDDQEAMKWFRLAASAQGTDPLTVKARTEAQQQLAQSGQ